MNVKFQSIVDEVVAGTVRLRDGLVETDGYRDSGESPIQLAALLGTAMHLWEASQRIPDGPAEPQVDVRVVPLDGLGSGLGSNLASMIKDKLATRMADAHVDNGMGTTEYDPELVSKAAEALIARRQADGSKWEYLKGPVSVRVSGDAIDRGVGPFLRVSVPNGGEIQVFDVDFLGPPKFAFAAGSDQECCGRIRVSIDCAAGVIVCLSPRPPQDANPDYAKSQEPEAVSS